MPRGWKMKTAFRFHFHSILLLAAALLVPAARGVAQSTLETAATASQAPLIPARITQAIDESRLVPLKGSVHPFARRQFDQGAVSGSLTMKRMLLVLKRSVEQESALLQLLSDQQNSNSPNFRRWLTPEKFGAQFGPADADVRSVTSWLESHGFQVAKTSKGKIAIEFSGTAAQIKEAFHTEIHNFLVNGELHMANASDPQIPAALAPVIRGLSPLHNFWAKPAHRVAGEFSKSVSKNEVKPIKPEFTTSDGNFAISPFDFAAIYNVLPLWNASPIPLDGSGQSIAVIATSNINLQDVRDFRTLFGLPTGGPANTPIVVIDGDDPGKGNDPDHSETEALADVEWAGAVAKGAQIHLVIAATTDLSNGLLLAILRVLDDNSDPVLNLSFGDCEPREGSSSTYIWEPFWEEAAAQGITATVAAGDTGSAGCDYQNGNLPPNPAIFGLQVNATASTPFDVAVGGTDFNDAGMQSTYFNAANDPNTQASAIGYIPESTWNETCTNASFNAITGSTNPEDNCNSTNPQAVAAVKSAGGGGGTSRCALPSGSACAGYPKPDYQKFINVANGMPADGARDLPDVSLFASTGFNKSFYMLCQADAVSSPSCAKSQSFHFLGVGGTSVASAGFAGIMALVNQKSGRQGNANFVLYKLAQMQYAASTACNSVAALLPASSCTFNDVTAGTIAMPCVKGSPDCTINNSAHSRGVLSGYNATAGYDLATGLGSVNAANLVNNWSTGVAAFTPTSVTLSLSPATGLTVGQSVTVNVAVTPSDATGDVILVSNAPTGEAIAGYTLGPGGQITNQITDRLTGGTYQVTARYGGDGTFAPSVSLPVTVTVGKANSTTLAAVQILQGFYYIPFTIGVAPLTLYLSAGPSPDPPSFVLPTGTVDFVDTFNGTATTVASGVGVNSNDEALTLPGISKFAVGDHSIVANYSGDASFNPSSSAPVTFTLTDGSMAKFTVAESAVTLSSSTGASMNATFTLTPTGGFAGTVNVTPSTTTPGVICTPSPLIINLLGPSPATGQLSCVVAATSTTLTAANAPPDPKTEASGLSTTRRANRWWALSAGTGFAALVLLFFPGRRRNYPGALGLGLACVLSFTLGCGGGSGGGGGGTMTVATVTKLTVPTAKVAFGTPFTFSVTVTGGAPGGMVQLLDNGVAIGTASAISGGTATPTAPALAAGTHSISARYSGDANTLASLSGVIHMTVTGTTTVGITTNPAASPPAPPLTVTIE